MAEIVAKEISTKYSADEIQNLRVLDLCSGCGVIGFELSWHLRALKNFDFVEVQDIYAPHFKKNTEIVNRPELKCKLHIQNYEKLKGAEWESQFDVVVCNPPYFQVGQGKMSPSEFKNRCRFYIDSTFQNLVESILRVLKPTGSAFVLLRPLSEHKLNLRTELERITSGRARLDFIADVRGTDLYRIAVI